MSRADAGPREAETLRVPDAPRLRSALRESLVDFYFNSWRLVPANAAWGGLLLALLVAVSIVGFPALLGFPLLGIPVAGIYRLAALIARGDAVSLGDAVAAWREYLVPSLVAGSGLGLAVIALATNIATGVIAGDFTGWALATLAFWGLVVAWSYAQVFWPLLVDPRRAELPVLARARLAALLLVAFPARFAFLALLAAFLLAVSTVLFAALLTISVAYVALVGTRYVLPAADRLEGRATRPVPA